MLLEQGFAPIVSEILPHAVDVIGLILRNVVSHQKAGTVQFVTVRSALFCGPGPSEIDILSPFFFYPVHELVIISCNLRAFCAAYPASSLSK